MLKQYKCPEECGKWKAFGICVHTVETPEHVAKRQLDALRFKEARLLRASMRENARKTAAAFELEKPNWMWVGFQDWRAAFPHKRGVVVYTDHEMRVVYVNAVKDLWRAMYQRAHAGDVKWYEEECHGIWWIATANDQEIAEGVRALLGWYTKQKSSPLEKHVVNANMLEKVLFDVNQLWRLGAFSPDKPTDEVS